MKPWIQTHLGLAFDLAVPERSMVDVADVAHALGNICRYTGHTRRFYSVAQHCVLGARAIITGSVERTELARLTVPQKLLALQVLCHDAHEAYVGDVSSPLKWAIDHRGPASRPVDKRVQAVVLEALGVRPVFANEVKEADIRMLMTEKAQLLGTPPEPWAFDAPPYRGVISPWSPSRAQEEWVWAWCALTGEDLRLLMARVAP